MAKRDDDGNIVNQIIIKPGETITDEFDKMIRGAEEIHELPRIGDYNEEEVEEYFKGKKNG